MDSWMVADWVIVAGVTTIFCVLTNGATLFLHWWNEQEDKEE